MTATTGMADLTSSEDIRNIFIKLNFVATADDNRRVRAVLTYLSAEH